MNDDNRTAVELSDEPPPVVHTPGSMLRKLREDAGLSLASVGETLHLTVHYVKALENDDYGRLPGLTFVKGYLRSYARLMKTDVDAVLASFDQYIASLVVEGERTEKVQRSQRRHDQALRWAIAMSVILILGVAGGWWFKGSSNNSAAASAITAPAPAVAATRAPVQTAATPALGRLSPSARLATATATSASVAGELV